LNFSISHDYKEEYEDIKKYLNSALNLVIDCEEPLFYSVPAQSVIKIGESFYKGKSKDHNISEYPLLIADTRSATNYFLVKEKGAEMTKITSSILGEGSLSQLGRLLLSSGDSSINGIVEKGIKEGNNLNCDLLVSDIYGESAKAINLPGEIIASCFGKPDYSFSSKGDIVKSLIIMHSLDISNITALLAQIH
jgi:pantothenate kinase